MDIRENIEAFWKGQKPRRIPYTIYWWEWRNLSAQPEWWNLFKEGLGVTYTLSVVSQRRKNVEYLEDTYVENARILKKRIMRTPIGEIYSIVEDDWVQKYWITTKEDYKVLTYIVENTEISPDYDSYHRLMNILPPFFVPYIGMPRTPIQQILVDYVGLENFSYHLFDYEDEIMTLYEALLKNFARHAEIIAEGPGLYVNCLENFTAETMGPNRYKKFHMPVYQKYFTMIRESGKIIGTHYDGKLKSCKDLIAEAPIDLIESLTPPPEGDMTLEECRKAWPNKKFWCNINVSNYYLPPKELKDLVYDLVRQGTVDGTNLAFEISEHYPQNWRESIPVVLEALKEISG